jgi:hypothetical protein
MEVEERRSKVDTFLAITGTSDAAAAEAMLEGNGWNVEGAIDFFFATGTTGASGSADAGGGGAVPLGGHGAPVGGDEGELMPTAAPGMADEDHELQMALAASMGQGAPVAPSGGGFAPPAFPPPSARPQFRPPTAPIPPHLRASSGSEDDEDTADAADVELRRMMQLSAAEGRGLSAEEARLQEVVNASRSAMPDPMQDLGLPHGAGMARLRAEGAGAGAGAGVGDDDATDAAFLEAALKESLDAPQVCRKRAEGGWLPPKNLTKERFRKDEPQTLF